MKKFWRKGSDSCESRVEGAIKAFQRIVQDLLGAEERALEEFDRNSDRIAVLQVENDGLCNQIARARRIRERVEGIIE